jgi:hypothetical protein
MPRRKRVDKRANYGLTREQVDALLISGDEPPGWNTIFDDDFFKALHLWERHRDRLAGQYAGTWGEQHLEPELYKIRKEA